MLRVLFLCLCVTSSAFASSSSIPDVSDLSSIAESVTNSLNDLEDYLNLTSDYSLQGAEGEANTPDTSIDSDIEEDMSGEDGGVETEPSQREPWTYDDEYTYSLLNDTDLPQLIDCMDYALVGACLSVRYTMFGPVFTFSFAVEHFVRDLHVEVVPQAPTEDITEVPEDTVLPSSSSPLEDITLVYPYTWKISKTLGSSLLTNAINSVLEEAEGQTALTRDIHYTYSDVQVSGNMERTLFDVAAESTIGLFGYCTSPTTAGMVYFNSTLDQFSWRWIATSETILMGLYQLKYLEWNDIGRSYGSTFPRSGYITNTNRFKSSVVAAIRGASIPLENRSLFSGIAGLHVYTPLSAYAEDSFTGSSYLTPQDAKTLKLDMVYPFEGERCTRYGANEDTFGNLSSEDMTEDDNLSTEFSKNNTNNTAIFKLYRPYRCCKKRGSKVYSVVSPGSIGTPK